VKSVNFEKLVFIRADTVVTMFNKHLQAIDKKAVSSSEFKLAFRRVAKIRRWHEDKGKLAQTTQIAEA
jgi:hypothetical protein